MSSKELWSASNMTEAGMAHVAGHLGLAELQAGTGRAATRRWRGTGPSGWADRPTCRPRRYVRGSGVLNIPAALNHDDLSRLRDPDRFRNSGGAQPLPFAERHDSVVAAGDLSGSAGELCAQLHPDRLSPLRVSGYGGGLQPAIGLATDRRPMFRISTAGMGASLAGLMILAFASHYWALILAAIMIGLGSSIFHPNSSRVARAASGGRFGLAQSLFQVGGNTGTAIGPLLAAFVVLPLGQPAIAWFSALALLGMIVLWNVGAWARAHHLRARAAAPAGRPPLPAARVRAIIAVLAVLVFSKYVYMASLTSFYTFYLIDTFGVSVRQAQLFLFVFLAAVAAGTFAGGPIGDRVGRKAVIWVSILGALPFALAMPHTNLLWTAVLSAIVGFVMASAFSAILVYAQALVPGRVGAISGLFFGSPSALPASEPPSLAPSPTAPALPSSSRLAPSCRRWGCWRRSCRRTAACVSADAMGAMALRRQVCLKPTLPRADRVANQLVTRGEGWIPVQFGQPTPRPNPFSARSSAKFSRCFRGL